MPGDAGHLRYALSVGEVMVAASVSALRGRPGRRGVGDVGAAVPRIHARMSPRRHSRWRTPANGWGRLLFLRCRIVAGLKPTMAATSSGPTITSSPALLSFAAKS